MGPTVDLCLQKRSLFCWWRAFLSHSRVGVDEGRDIEEVVPHDIAFLEEDIREEEVRMALHNMKLGKAAGHDSITPEMLNYTSSEWEKLLSKILRLSCGYKSVLYLGSVFFHFVLVPLFKKGDNRDWHNHEAYHDWVC